MSEHTTRPVEGDEDFDALLRAALVREHMPADLADATMRRIRQARAAAETSERDEDARAASPTATPRPCPPAPDTPRRPAHPSRPTRRLTRRGFVTLLAACLGTATLAAGGVVALASETAQVEVGDAPAIRLGLNRLSRVVRATGTTAQLQARLDVLGLVSLTCADAIERIAGDEELRAELAPHGNGHLTIAVSSDSEAQQTSVLGQCRRATQQAGAAATCRAADAETLEAARSAGMGVARYEVYLQIAELDPGVSVEQCRSMSMRQLRALLAQKQAEAQAQAEGTEPSAQQAGGDSNDEGDAPDATPSGTSSPRSGPCQPGQSGQTTSPARQRRGCQP